jgi:hypothetical protein
MGPNVDRILVCNRWNYLSLFNKGVFGVRRASNQLQVANLLGRSVADGSAGGGLPGGHFAGISSSPI